MPGVEIGLKTQTLPQRAVGAYYHRRDRESTALHRHVAHCLRLLYYGTAVARQTPHAPCRVLESGVAPVMLLSTNTIAGRYKHDTLGR